MIRTVLVTLASFSAGLLVAEDGPVERVTQVYDIRFLTDEVPHAPAETWPTVGRAVLDDHVGEESAAPISFTDDADLSLGEDEESVELGGGVRIDPDQLVELIQSNISEDSWANSRNEIRATKGRLVVTQTASVQGAIAALLERLGARRSSMVSVEVLLVPAEAVSTEKPFLDEAELLGVVERAGKRADRVVLTAYNEQTTGSFRGRSRSVLLGDEVNQVGVVPTSNPMVATLATGRTVEIAPLAVAGSDWTRVSVRLAKVRETGNPAADSTPAGEIRHVQAAELALSTVLLLKPGTVGVAGYFSESDRSASSRRFAVLCRLQDVKLRESRPAAPPDPQTFVLRAYDLGFLVASLPGDELTLQADEFERLLPRLAEADDWKDERSSVEAADDRFLTVVARPETHRAVARWLRGALARRGRVSSVRVEELSGGLGSLLDLAAEADEGAYLRDGWRNRLEALGIRRRFRARSNSMLGALGEATALEARTFSSGVETISGGTGFALVDRAQPRWESAGSGFKMSALVREALDPSALHVELELERVALDLSRSKPFQLRVYGPGEVQSPALGGGSSRGRAVRFPIALPSQAVTSQRFELALRKGRAAVMSVEDDGGGRGRMLVVEAELHEAIEAGE